MSEQWVTYRDSDTVSSDTFGLIDRNNRNHRKKAELIEGHTKADADDMILEVGCGHGLHTARYTRHWNVHAVDLSPSLVAAAQKRAPSAVVRQADATRLPYDDDLFAAVHGTAILHHLPDIESALREWLRVTESGGSVTLMEPNWLFPKDLVSSYLVPEEQHKRQMKPWVVRDILDSLGREYRHEPQIYTPPWPRGLTGFFDRLDDLGQEVPGARWLSQMQLIHVEA